MFVDTNKNTVLIMNGNFYHMTSGYLSSHIDIIAKSAIKIH